MQQRRKNSLLIGIIALLFPLLSVSALHAQYRVYGRVLDRKTGEGLPFAVLMYGSSEQGILADVNGNYSISVSSPIKTIEVSHLGYRKRSFSLSWSDSVQQQDFFLRRENRYIEEVIITPGINPALELLERSLKLKALHNPTTLAQYTYLDYSKLRASIQLDSSSLKDPEIPPFERFGDSTAQRILFFLSESLSRHDHARGKPPVDVVLSTHTSGTRNPRITYLAAMIQPTSFYNEEVTLVGHEYINPYSVRGLRRYRYRLQDTILTPEGDSLFQIRFSPRRTGEDLLTGSMIISSKDLALEEISVNESGRKRLALDFLLHHRYKQDRNTGRWFPDEYYVSLHDSTGVLQIESITAIRDIKVTQLTPLQRSRHIAISYEPIAERERDSILRHHRIEPLNSAEISTYKIVDSIGEKYHFDKYLSFLEVLATGRVKLGYVQLVLDRVLGYNQYEKTRLGIGVETSQELSSHFQLGGYYAYGFGDAGHKFGGDLLLPLNPENGLELRFYYTNDLRSVGHTQRSQVTSFLGSIPLNNLYLRKMDREVRYGVEMALRIPFYMQIAFAYVNNQNDSQWGYIQQLDKPYQLINSRFTLSYSPNEQYIHFHRGLIPYRRSPLRIQLQVEHGVRVKQWSEQFIKGELLLSTNTYSTSYGEFQGCIQGGIIAGKYPFAYGYSNRGIGRKMDEILVDGNSFVTIPSDQYYNDVYSYFYALYNTMPWRDLTLGKSHHLGVAALLNAGWGKQLSHYTPYAFSAPSFTQGIVETGLGVSYLKTGGLLPSQITLFAIYRVHPFTTPHYQHNFGFGFSLVTRW